MTCSAKAIICDEIFDENSLPSEQEVRDYAARIGINPDTEKHLLHIALDGLMSPLPEDWKACLDERIHRIYYYNVKTQQTQWAHPLDEHFEKLVKKKRQEESISAGDDDSKTSIKEDLKSFEEAVTTSEMMPAASNLSDGHKSRLTTANQLSMLQALKEPSPDRRKVLNPIGRPPLPPKRRAGSTSPKRGSERGSLSLRLSPGPSPTRIDIDSLGVPLGLSSPSPEPKPEKLSGGRTPAIKLTGEEKEKLRIQEMKDERKQNVRFADIVNKPINIQFSKSDSEDDSTTDSSNDLEDLILEHVYSDDEVKKEIKIPEKRSPKMEKAADLNENLEGEQPPKGLKLNETLSSKKESNKNILTRLSDLNMESERRDVLGDKKKRMIEVRNNNTEDSDDWLTDKQNIMNQNEQKIQKLRNQMFDNTKIGWDLENNAIDNKHLTEVALGKSHKMKDLLKSNDRPTSPSKFAEFAEIIKKDTYVSSPISKSNSGPKNSKQIDLKKIHVEDSNDNSNLKPTEEFRRSKLMPEVDLQKVFKSMRESIANNDASEEAEPMETSPLDGDEIQSALEQNEGDLQQLSTGVVYRSPTRDKRMARKFDEYKEQQRRHYDEKKATLILEFEESTLEMQKELQRQESLERQRLYMEVQESVAHYKAELEAEKEDREKHLRNNCEDYLRELEQILDKEKDAKVNKIKEDHETFLKDQEKKINEEKFQFEEETKIRLKTSSSQLEKIMMDLKQKEEKEVLRLTEESNKRIDSYRQKIEMEQAEQEKKHKQELEIVEAEYKRDLAKKQSELERLKEDHEAALAVVRSQQDQAIAQLTAQHCKNFQQLQEQCHQEEELMRKRHSEKMDALNAQLSKMSEKEDITQINREFEKVRCEKRLLEDKYKSLKEKYMRLKNEVRLSMERKRQAKLNRQLQQRDTASTTEDTTERSTDHGKPPLARKKLPAPLSSDEATGENANGTPKTIKRRPKHVSSVTTSSVSATAESSSTPPAKPKNVWNPSPHQRREGASLAEDNHTSVSEEIQMEQDDYGEKWTQSALSPLDNLRKQLEKLDDLEEQFPTSVHMDTYLRYPFSGPAGASCELDFYRHRLHLERESVRRAKQALAEQRHNIESRQLQLRHKQHTETLHQLHQEERELTDMEVSLHRTRALLGEKIIRLRYLEQSIERAAAYTPHHSQDTTTITNTDSSGFSGSDLDLSNTGQCVNGRPPEMFWTENVLQSLENINSEIREIWTILGKQQVPGLGPPPVLNYERRAIGQGGVDSYTLAPHRANDIADRTRRLKEWLIRVRDQQTTTHLIAPVNL
ncbi:centrosomal protein of 164 kDa-like isoform X2 [Homalodisca vitripennis]|uniref:centrosomal protein of 164 kDa-like isoform X2 n=1 Tax=Homalodisca vitripennis TaxID=197043 RepID=UPI001EEB9570|nr:centrosomal protein of 164 kDa-like isoform X2 [Homalodisca vitripennis]